ncbi:MAG: hypothetical protein HZB23_13020 [Deltaproteobacteria bacterium]|nr:hypothetical protein [Deltaproteobacteria bacterium]
MADKKQIVLDDEAEALFRDLGGVEAVGRGRGISVPGLAEAIHNEEKKQDAWRLLLVDLVFDFAQFLDACRNRIPAAATESVAQIMLHLEKLSRMPDADGRILVRHRGNPVPESGRVSATFDYIIIFGNLNLDMAGAKAAGRRLGVTAAKLAVRMQEAFAGFAENEINTVFLALGDFDQEERAGFKRCMEALFAFFSKPHSRKDGAEPFVLDETRSPDPNLALLFSINAVKAEVADELSKKVRAMLLKAPPGDPLEQYLGVYDAVFAFKKLRDQLKRPPIEINQPRWLLATGPGDAIDPVRARITRLLCGVLGKGSPMTAKTIYALSADDYGKIDAVELAIRVGLVGNLLEALERALPKGPVRDETRKEILVNLEARLGLAGDKVYDEIVVSGSLIKVRGGELKSEVRQSDPALVELVEFFQHRSLVKEKIRTMLQSPVRFDPEDYEVIARDFSISGDDSARLLELLKASFDDRGHFVRKAFEKNIPVFVKHGGKVFEFLWHYLKDLVHRQDRVALLNALQVLIDQMKKRREAFIVLMEDFIRDPETLAYHDRNALMLANLMLRKYNKELHNDIEVTPEEVLLVQEGLAPEMTDFAAEWMEQEKERLLIKLRTVHRALKETLDSPDPVKPWPIRYALTLEREAYILLALIGGPITAAVIKSALAEYGNPDAEIYWLKKSEQNLTGLVGILQALVRTACRHGDNADLDVLRRIERSENQYLGLKRDQRHADSIRRLMQWVDKACELAADSGDSEEAFRF